MTPPTDPLRPIENSYLVPGTRLFAGEYPGSPPSNPTTELEQKLAGFLDAGITVFVDLTDTADGLAPYAPALHALAAERDVVVRHEQLTITDMSTCDAVHMRRVLDVIDASLDAGHGVYVHCWGGIGRTGMVVGCWLVRHGRSGDAALEEVNALFRTMSPKKVARHESWGSPQTEPQRQMVRDWATQECSVSAAVNRTPHGVGTHEPDNTSRDDVWSLLSPSPSATPELRDRMRGALIGLAVGDAVGTTVEFQPRGSFPPVTNMVGGGPFRLEPGQWTDDTSMALCLAESLIERRAFDPHDQMERYLRWRDLGHLSSNGRCFDIGNTVSAALRQFQATRDPFSGPTGERTAGNGSLMRLAPVPVFFFGRNEDVAALAADMSRTTHGAQVAVDACRYLAALVTGALGGATRSELLDSTYEPEPGYWRERPLHPVIAGIAAGSFRTRPAPEIRGSGYAADALEAALWAFHNSSDFREGCLLAVNLGDDADTTAAIYGQLAGALYGESGIPAEWRAKLARKPLLDRYAEALFQLSFGSPPAMGSRGAMVASEAEEMIAAAGGDAALAIAQFLAEEERAKKEMGVLAYHMSGSVAAQAMRDELLLNLRIALGASLAGSSR